MVTTSSLAYIATQVRIASPVAPETLALTIRVQVRFALSSSPVFSRTDTVTDSEFFYNLIADLLEDESEHVEVADLMKWWNRYG